MKVLKIIKDIFNPNNDPVRQCLVFKRYGCAHVDGPLCDFPKCDIYNKYMLHEDEQMLDIPYNLRKKD